MKKSKIIVLFLSFLMLLSQTSFSFAGDGGVILKLCDSTTVCVGDFCSVDTDKATEKFLQGCDDVIVTSSDNSVIKAYKDYFEIDGIEFKAKGTGTATLTVTAKKEDDEGEEVVAGTYTMIVNVVPYSNPFSSVKVGKYQVKKFFNSENGSNRLNLKKLGNKKISVTTKDGWSVVKLHYQRYGLGGKYKNSKTIKNNSGKFSLKKTSKKYNQYLDIYISNPDYYNGAVQVFSMNMCSKKANIS